MKSAGKVQRRRLESQSNTPSSDGPAVRQTADALPDPLAQLSHKEGNGSSAQVMRLSLTGPRAERRRAPGVPYSHLQRQYGNRYVQQVVANRKAAEPQPDAAPEIEQAIQRRRGSGQVLDAGVRTKMEPAFNVDFGGVRVHTDAQADTLSRSLNARAFTTGQDLFFRQGEYNPGSSAGRELLAHELTHVVQQSGSARVQRRLANPAMMPPPLPVDVPLLPAAIPAAPQVGETDTADSTPAEPKLTGPAPAAAAGGRQGQMMPGARHGGG